MLKTPIIANWTLPCTRALAEIFPQFPLKRKFNINENLQIITYTDGTSLVISIAVENF